MCGEVQTSPHIVPGTAMAVAVNLILIGSVIVLVSMSTVPV